MNAGLEKQLADMHQKATQLDGLIHALNACIDDPARRAFCVSIIEECTQIAPMLSEGLDTPSRWEV